MINGGDMITLSYDDLKKMLIALAGLMFKLYLNERYKAFRIDIPTPRIELNYII